MPTPRISSFTQYEFGEKELYQAQVLSPIQKLHIQTILGEAAENRINLDFDPLNPTKYAQDEAFLKGQISVLRLLLELSEAAEQFLISDAQPQSQSPY